MADYIVPKPIVIVVSSELATEAVKESLTIQLAEAVHRYAQDCVDNAIAYERRHDWRKG